MKNSTLMNFRDCKLLVVENGFKMDFSRQSVKSSIGKTPEKKSSIPSFLILVLLFLFTNFLFAQQPACNLRGILESKRLRDGGQNFVINSDIYKAVPGTIYKWEFKSNNSAASFATANGTPNITINPGNKNGEFNLKLTVINPAVAGRSSKSCSCTKSVSIGNL